MSKFNYLIVVFMIAALTMSNLVHGAWQQRKFDEFRRNSFNLDINHQDWIVGNAIPYNEFTQTFQNIASTIVFDNKKNYAYMLGYQNEVQFIQVNLVNGNTTILNLNIAGFSDYSGGVLDDDGFYYALMTTTTWDHQNNFYTHVNLVKINVNTGDFKLETISFDKTSYDVIYSSKESLLVLTTEKGVYGISTSNLEQVWFNEYKCYSKGILLVTSQVSGLGYDILYACATKLRVRDGFQLSPNSKVYPDLMTYLDKPDLVAFTGNRNITLINHDTGIASSILLSPYGCYFPMYIGGNEYKDYASVNIVVSCLTKSNPVNYFLTGSVLTSGIPLGIEVNNVQNADFLGVTGIVNSANLITRTVNGYNVLSSNGKLLATVPSSFNSASTCEVFTASNGKIYAFCLVGKYLSFESKSIPKIN